MKKLFFYFLIAAISVNFFMACDNDDDKPKVEEWEAISKEFQMQELTLTLDGKDISIMLLGRSVYVDAQSETQALITLNNVLPDKKEFSIPATLSKKDGKYNVSGSTQIDGDTEITIAGTVVHFKADLSFTKKVTSDLAYTWKLDYSSVSGAPMAKTYLDISTGDEDLDKELQQLATGIGVLIASKVDGARVSLSDKGIFDANWTKSDQVFSIENYLGTIQYILDAEELTVALDKSLLNNTDFKALVELLGIDTEKLFALFSDLGGYYGLPVKYALQEGGNEVNFYLEKDRFLQIMQFVSTLLKESSPELQEILDKLGEVLPAAEKFNFGLTFTISEF